MKESIYSYFQAEKVESIFFMLVGIFFFFLSIILFFKYGEFQKYFSIPAFIIALIQIVVGSTVFFRTDKQIETLNIQFESSKTNFQLEETNRMNIVIKSFKTYKLIEISFIIISLLGFIFTFSKPNPIIEGFCSGLLIQSSLMLIADVIAEARGQIYFQFLQNIQV